MPEAQFMLNLTHPIISRVYAAFKAHNKMPLHFPIGDNDRERFEALFMLMSTQDNFEEWVEEYTSILRPQFSRP